MSVTWLSPWSVAPASGARRGLPLKPPRTCQWPYVFMYLFLASFGGYLTPACDPLACLLPFSFLLLDHLSQVHQPLFSFSTKKQKGNLALALHLEAVIGNHQLTFSNLIHALIHLSFEVALILPSQTPPNQLQLSPVVLLCPAPLHVCFPRSAYPFDGRNRTQLHEWCRPRQLLFGLVGRRQPRRPTPYSGTP